MYKSGDRVYVKASESDLIQYMNTNKNSIKKCLVGFLDDAIKLNDQLSFDDIISIKSIEFTDKLHTKEILNIESSNIANDLLDQFFINASCNEIGAIFLLNYYYS